MLKDTLSTPFTFDLQLFADEEGMEQAESVSDDSDYQEPEYNYFGDDDDDAEESAEAEQAYDDGTLDEQAFDEDGTQEDDQQGKTYTVYVNGEPRQVTEHELLKGYMQEADYTRKMQELAEQRRAVEQFIEEIQQEAEPEPSPMEERMAIAELAKERFYKETGMEFDSFDQEHVLYMADIANEVRTELGYYQQLQAIQQQQQYEFQTLANNVQNYTASYFGNDPNLATLGQFAEDMWNDDVTAREQRSIMEACQQGNYAALNPFLERVRQRAYGRMHHKRPPGNPPAQERAGQGGDFRQKFSMKSLAKMDTKRAANVAAKFKLFD